MADDNAIAYQMSVDPYLNNRNILESGISVTKFNFSLSIHFLWFSTNRILITFSVDDSILATSIAAQNWRKLEGRIRSNLPKFLTNKMGFCTTVHSLFNINFVIMCELCQFIPAKTFSYQSCLYYYQKWLPRT